MQAEPDPSHVIGALQSGLASGDLSPAVQAHAQHLVERLQARVRVALIGPAGVGKTQLLSVLLGEAQVGGSNCHYTCDPKTRAMMTGLRVCAAKASILNELDLINLEWSDGAAGSVSQALQIADVVLWCTQAFDKAEAAVWSTAPDHLKDHSFLVLTKADALAAKGTLQQRITDLAAVVREEFHSLFPTTTQMAMQDLKRTGEVPLAAFAASGAKALSDAITKLALDGRQADMDAALLFVKRHGLEVTGTSGVADPDATISGTATTYDKALQILRTRLTDVHLPEGEADAADVSTLLEQCGAASEDLMELACGVAAEDLMELAYGPETEMDADHAAWCDDIMSAADKITLMSMENSLTAAADALGILAQLRLELEVRKTH